MPFEVLFELMFQLANHDVYEFRPCDLQYLDQTLSRILSGVIVSALQQTTKLHNDFVEFCQKCFDIQFHYESRYHLSQGYPAFFLLVLLT